MSNVAPTDLARTIGSIVGVEAGGSYSRVLPCAIDDRKAILDTVLHEIAAGKPITLVAEGPLAKTLPAGYARLDTLTIDGDTAQVRIWTGPIPQPQPGVVLLDCGTGHGFTLKKNDYGEWILTGRSVIVC
jgi:hypothetical protein